jgi:hypothetical protein
MTRLRPSGFGEAGAQDVRIRAVTEFGFTERQARFVVLVNRDVNDPGRRGRT